MLAGLAFGWRTAILTVVVAQLLLMAIALASTMANRTANRTLAVLLTMMALLVTPWLIGFAGFYDRWMWLTFAPFQITLAIAPLAWLYGVALTSGRWPPLGWMHMLPAGVQVLYLSICFVLPLDVKLAWANRTDAAYSLLTGAILIAQMAGYSLASARQLSRYRLALANQTANDHRFAARWLSATFAALAILFIIWAAHLLIGLFVPLDYKALMGLYLAIGFTGLFLGIEGWRHAALPFPLIAPPAPAPAADARDWEAQGRAWAAIIREQQWARDPDVNLAGLARLLGTNSSYLSRAINSGAGENFSSFIARLRAEAVAARLTASDPADLLTIALEEGFGSKASFNRAFAAAFGCAPSVYRHRVSKHEKMSDSMM